MERVRRKVLIPTEPGIGIGANTTYRRKEGVELLQIIERSIASDTFGKFLGRMSKDNGKTWSEASLIFEPKETQGGVLRWGENAFLLDEEKDVLILFYNYHLYPERLFTGDVERFTRIFYKMSWDGSISFSEPEQLIQEGYGAENWAKDVVFGKNNAAVSFCAPIKTRKGKIVLPIQKCPIDADFRNPWLIKWEAGCFIGEWKGKNIKWEPSQMSKIDAGLSSRGLCEPAIAELNGGLSLMVCRGSNFRMSSVPGYKWYSLSRDGGYIWSHVSPFCYDDGGEFFSPATGSRLIRSTRNGKLYWIGNIVPENPDGNRPRYPLQIAEVNENKIGLRKDSVVVIDDRREDDSPLVQLSNFKVYEDRETGVFVLTMARYQEKGEELTSPAYEYRINII